MSDYNGRPDGPMPPFYGEEYDPADVSRSRSVSLLAYIPFLFFLPLVVCPDSRFGKFHANQGLVLFLVWTIIGTLLHMIPFIGGLLGKVFALPMLLLMVCGMLRAYGGRAVPLPFIGGIRIIR